MRQDLIVFGYQLALPQEYIFVIYILKMKLPFSFIWAKIMTKNKRLENICEKTRP